MYGGQITKKILADPARGHGFLVTSPLTMDGDGRTFLQGLHISLMDGSTQSSYKGTLR